MEKHILKSTAEVGFEKRGNTNAVVSLSRQQDEAREIAQRIDQSDELGR